MSDYVGASSWALALCLYIFLTLSDRMGLSISVLGDRPVGVPPLLLLGALAIRAALPRRSPPLDAPSRDLLIGILPFLVLAVSLPLMGVMTGLYAVTSLYSLLGPILLIGLLTLVRVSGRERHMLMGAIFLAIVTHGVYAAGQLLFRMGVLSASIWGWARKWDLASQEALSEDYILVGRSIGLFINPNVFGLWSVVSVLFSVVILRGWKRRAGVVFGLLGVAASQSRTAVVCLIFLLVCLAVAATSRKRSQRPGPWLATLLFIGIPLSAAFILMGGRVMEAGFLTRLDQAFGAGLSGVGEDENFKGRLVAWDESLTIMSEDPRIRGGTLGPPQVYTQYSIDNQFLAHYLQGGWIYVTAYVLFLACPLILMARRSSLAAQLGALTGVLAIASFTLPAADCKQVMVVVMVYAIILLGRADQGAQVSKFERVKDEA